MRYEVIEGFCDMQDGDREYKPGDEYPKYAGAVGENRLKELSSTRNKLGRALIKAVGAAEKPAPLPTPIQAEEPVKKPSRKKAK